MTSALGPRTPLPDPRLPPEPIDPIPAPDPPPYPIDPEPYPRYEDVPPTDPVDTEPVDVSNAADSAQDELPKPSSHRRAGAVADKKQRFGDGTRDLVDEASWESFPASDPPGRGIA